MRAVVYEAFGAAPEVRDVPEPGVPDGGVVVRVERTGLCRSDWHGWAGHDPDIRLPHVPGHELAGTVAAVGTGVRRWTVGDRVTVPFVCGCGACVWCRAGDAQVCPEQTQPGFTGWGSFAEYVALHHADTNLVALPDPVSYEAAAGLGCRVATAYRALVGRAAARPGEWLVVVGCGGVGLSAVQIGRALGMQVVGVDRSREALGLAAAYGAVPVVADGTPEAVAAVVAGLTDGGAHVGVDAVGAAVTCATSVLSLRRRGRHVQVGLLAERPAVPMDRVIGWELDLLGSHGMAASDYPALLDLVASGAVDPAALVARTVGLDEAARLLPTMADAPLPGVTLIAP